MYHLGRKTSVKGRREKCKSVGGAHVGRLTEQDGADLPVKGEEEAGDERLGFASRQSGEVAIFCLWWCIANSRMKAEVVISRLRQDKHARRALESCGMHTAEPCLSLCCLGTSCAVQVDHKGPMWKAECCTSYPCQMFLKIHSGVSLCPYRLK